MQKVKRQIFFLLTILVSVILMGTFGYYFVESWNFSDSLFMTIITMSTVGYGEVNPLSENGKIFTIALNLIGIGLYSYSFFAIMSLVSSGHVRKMLRRSKMDKLISQISDHYIICGVGETGKYIMKELENTGKDFVLIEKDEDSIRQLGEKGLLYLEGDSHDENILKAAGIERAKGIFCTLPDDKENIFLVLSAKELNEDIRIISKCVGEQSEKKFYRAGAFKVIYQNRIGVLRMASEMLRPSVVTFLDKMLRKNKAIRFEEVFIPKDSHMVGQTIPETNIIKDFNVAVMAVQIESGDYVYYSGKDIERHLLGNEYVIVIGCQEDINRLRKHANKGH
ncbi:MAG: hypothetical protein C0601_10560 [Candidatus Muiribacterium halophilum]|uniref:RCK N-terminal domain-containing protein n=1 Tax=Muiribacterium halophilum TaxID=2053465 RepID=A0A2N5ZC49_MUIH1|nr:MAG: hypothetical protein C0601_10560 [Candidatus Muirbacterium halophilum]